MHDGSGTSAEEFEAVVERQLAAAILRLKQRLEPDYAIWWNLVDVEAQLRREHERVDEISDENAPSVKELKRKLVAVERGLAYLKANQLDSSVGVLEAGTAR